MFTILQNNPKHLNIFIKSNIETKILGRIQTLPKGEICFYPEKINKLQFLGNGKIYNWPEKETHITFHNTGRVHIGKKGVIFDYGIHGEDKNIGNNFKKRESISNHKPQTLFKLKIKNFDFLEDKEFTQNSIVLEYDKKNSNMFFTCGIFDGKSFLEAKSTGNDPFGLLKVGIFNNTYMLGLGEFNDINNIKDGTKILFFTIRDYEEYRFKDNPYLLSVSQYQEVGDIPY